MTKFTNVIVRKPGKSLCNGITSAPELGQPIYERAVEEHDDYIAALKQCGVEVTELPALEEYPDSCFVEDPAVYTLLRRILTNPGADSRNGEKTRSSRPSASSSTTSTSSTSSRRARWTAATS